MPDHGGNRTYDLWNTSPMLCQLSYSVWSVRVRDISEQNLVPSMSMLSNNNHDSIPTVVRHIFQACPVWICTQSNITSVIVLLHDFKYFLFKNCFNHFIKFLNLWSTIFGPVPRPGPYLYLHCLHSFLLNCLPVLAKSLCLILVPCQWKKCSAILHRV